jgi:hypothetical protein
MPQRLRALAPQASLRAAADEIRRHYGQVLKAALDDTGFNSRPISTIAVRS